MFYKLIIKKIRSDNLSFKNKMQNFHSNYHDYLIFKTAQKNSLRNVVITPDINRRLNLPLYLNYQVKKIRNNQANPNFQIYHEKISGIFSPKQKKYQILNKF